MALVASVGRVEEPVAHEILDRFVIPLGPLDGPVHFAYISGMMLVVMDFHRPRVDVRLQGIVSVGE